MIKLTKPFATKLCTLIFALMIASSACFTAFAQGTTKNLVDDADLFTDEEETQILSAIEYVKEQVGWDIAVYTNENGVDEDGFATYCEDYYLEIGMDTETGGALLVIDMDSRMVWVTTNGRAISYWTDERVDENYYEVADYLADGYYYDAVTTFLDNNIYYFNEGPGAYIINEDGYRVDEKGELLLNDGRPVDKNGDIVFENIGDRFMYNLSHYWYIAILVAVAVSLITGAVIKVRYKGNGKSNLYNFDENCKYLPTDNEDIHFDTKVTVRPIPRDTGSSGGSRGSGGGSSSHSGSGGHSFGGGGGKF